MRVLHQRPQRFALSSAKCLDRAFHSRVFRYDVAAPGKHLCGKDSNVLLQLRERDARTRPILRQNYPQDSTALFALRTPAVLTAASNPVANTGVPTLQLNTS